MQFGWYGIVKSGFVSEQILDRLGHKCLMIFFGHKEGETCWGLKTTLEVTNSAFRQLLKHKFLITAATVTTI
jgi:hypothetical protein